MMKISFAFLASFVACAIPVAAQNQTRERRVNESLVAPIEKSARTRVVADERDANHVRHPDSTITEPTNNSNANSSPAWGDTSVTFQQQSKTAATSSVTANPKINSNNLAQPNLVKPTTLTINNAPAPVKTVAVPTPGNAGNPASVYRVGVGDVLDIRLSNMATRESSLFTVLENGSIEYPLIEKPLTVAGLTTDEIAQRINTEVKVIQNARASVAVRDYTSHSVVITGVVDSPGQKILRREAMPLFALLAEALPRAEAATVTILRNGKEISIPFANNEQMATLVMPGDAIKVDAATKEFVYVGGEVPGAGEKELRTGMTLTQALLAAGGIPQDVQTAKIARRNADGLLTTQPYSLAMINAGKAPDPLLQAGDRIEVRRGVW